MGTVTDAFGKNKIVFVPGKNPKPAQDAHRALLWRCLRHGVELVDPAAADTLTAHPGCFELIAWNAIYYGQVKDVEEDIPWIELLCQRSGPHADDVRAALSWRKKRARLLYTIADFIPSLIPLLPDPAVRSTIRETERYFQNQDGIGTRLRALIKTALQTAFASGERVCLIGHSLGAAIAYDALWELTHLDKHPGQVDLFLTLGSPLGMRFVQDRLLGFRQRLQRFPCNIRRWVNVAAHGDIAALDPDLHDDFLPMLGQGCVEAIEDQHRDVFNYFRNEHGLNEHRSYGYLVEAHVARTVAGWWRGAGVPNVALAGAGGMA